MLLVLTSGRGGVPHPQLLLYIPQTGCPSVPKSVKTVLFNSLARYKCIPTPPFPLLLDTPLHTITWVFSEVRESKSDEYHIVKEIIRRNKALA